LAEEFENTAVLLKLGLDVDNLLFNCVWILLVTPLRRPISSLFTVPIEVVFGRVTVPKKVGPLISAFVDKVVATIGGMLVISVAIWFAAKPAFICLFVPLDPIVPSSTAIICSRSFVVIVLIGVSSEILNGIRYLVIIV
jgi:hypothetical protein